MIRVIIGLFICLVPQFSYAHDPAYIRYLVIDGAVTVETSGPSITPTTPFAIASVGKTFTSVAILQQINKGRLSLDQSVAPLLARSVVQGFGGLNGITLRHLLTMTSGLPDYYTDAYLDDALADPETTQTPLSALSYAYGEPTSFRAGRGFEYSNTNYVLLGLILERATNQSYAQILTNNIFSPLGLKNTFVFGSRTLPKSFPTGHENGDHIRDYYNGQGFGDGGVVASAQDMVTFYQALLVKKSLLPPHLLEEMLHDPKGENYGMGIEVDMHYGHSGGDLGFSSDIRFNPKTAAIAVEFVARGDADINWTTNSIRN